MPEHDLTQDDRVTLDMRIRKAEQAARNAALRVVVGPHTLPPTVRRAESI